MMVTALGEMFSQEGSVLLGRAGRSFMGSGMVRILFCCSVVSRKV